MAEQYFLGTETSERFPLWTRANVGEVFPDPVAMSSFDFAFLNADGIRMAELGWRDAYVRLGAFSEDEFDPDRPVILGVFGGYAYLNASIMRVFGERAPGLSAADIDAQFFGVQPGIPDYEPHPDDASPEAEARIGATFGWALTTDGLPDVLADEEKVDALRASRPEFGAMADGELLGWAERVLDESFRHLFSQHLFVTLLATLPAGIITEVSTALGRPQDALKLLAGLGDVESAAPSMAMWELGRKAAASATLTREFEAGLDNLNGRLRALVGDDVAAFNTAFDEFLYAYGCRGPNEWETRCPTWETEPDLALAAIDRMRLSPESAAPTGNQSRMATERERIGAEMFEMLAADPEAQGQFGAALGSAGVFMPGRERTKTNCIKLIHEVRMAYLEFGRRMVERGVFPEKTSYGMVTFAEGHRLLADPTGWREVIEERKAVFDEASQLQEPFVVFGEAPPLSAWPRRDAVEFELLGVGESIQGMPGCPGVAQGRARVVLDSHDPTDFDPGDVLVAPLTDPSWTPLFVPASGIVVDVGAPLSHAIIVSRELGVPCVVSATDATRRIPDGALVEVNGETGQVTILEV
ncbi:MAG: phosphoenolpyruvate-utilizing protein [Actinobacteria bacterium]|nr:phosphoenolpyruvate-utilizing protein [Actinomycetota bacterium]